MSKKTAGIIFFALLILINGCESMNYRSAIENNTIEGYDKFLNKYGESEYAPEVRKRKEELTWQKAKNENSFFSYKSYMEEYPQGKHFSDALNLAKESVERLNRVNSIIEVENHSETDYINAQKYIEYHEITQNPNNFVELSIKSIQKNKDTSVIQDKNAIMAFGSKGILDTIQPIFYSKVKSKAKYCTFTLRVKVQITQEGYIRYKPLLTPFWQEKKAKGVHDADSEPITVAPQSSIIVKIEFKKQIELSGANSSWGSSAELNTKITDIKSSFFDFFVKKPL